MVSHETSENPGDGLVALAEQARTGDVLALERLLAGLLPRARNLVRYLTRDDHDVDDMAQTGLLLVARRLSTYEARGSFTAWVDRIVARTTIKELEKQRLAERASSAPLLEGLPRVPESDRTDDYATRRWLVRLLDQLPPEQHDAFVMCHVLELGAREIAEETAAPLESVRGRLRLARGRLRALGAAVEPVETATGGDEPDEAGAADRPVAGPTFARLDDRPGPARAMAREREREVVRAVLARLVAGEAAAPSPEPAAPPPRRWATFAVVGMVVGVALAGAAILPEKAVPPAPSTDIDQPEELPPPATAPIVGPPAPAPAPGRAPKRALASAADRLPVDPLGHANVLRGERHWAEAAAAYADAARRLPGSETAHVAMVARAGLLLERLARPAEALALYQAVLAARPQGHLTEEALYGIAGCYRALGAIDAERSALRAFIAAQPGSPQRRRAEARLAQLDGVR